MDAAPLFLPAGAARVGTGLLGRLQGAGRVPCPGRGLKGPGGNPIAVRAARALQTGESRRCCLTGMISDAAFRCAVPRWLLSYPRCAFGSGSIQKRTTECPRPSAHVWVSSLKHEGFNIFILKKPRFLRCFFHSSLPSIPLKASHARLLRCPSSTGLQQRCCCSFPQLQ